MIYVVCGPTGSGKTKASLVLSEKLSAPIINADAFQIYQDMNIGTAKIEKDHPLYDRHFLLDIKKPSDSFSVQEYQYLFRKTLEQLQKQYDNIIVCGGTGLYIKASLYDYDFPKDNNVDVSDLEKLSNGELFALLEEIDHDATINLHKNNRKRVIRAITIARNGLTKSENIQKQKHEMIYSDVRILFINPDRTKLYENINNRVDQMFDEGLVNEVKNLLNNYELSLTAKAAIGYKEVISYIQGELSLEECKELIKKRTRNYAKRQITYFKNQLECEAYSSSEQLIKEIKDGINI
ncbi:MAG: tRNA (adenosine(37)-N6)-dimethylallyltransferase MiaA [Bacilli bacterium]|nr:tRNA (adenosine(37)-N6)-dimethylallyltransferase MiaA [Bacilli bacterium]